MNKITVNGQNIIIAIIWIIVSLIEHYIIKSIYDEGRGIKGIAIILIINLIMQLGTIRLCKHKVISFFGAFILFMYLFHFGQIFSTAFFSTVKFDTLNYVETYMSDQNKVLKTIEVCMNTVNFFFIGGLLAWKNNNVITKSDNDSGCDICFKYGRMLFIISFPFRFFFDIEKLVIALKSGYGGVLTENTILPGVFSAIASFWYISVILILVGITDKQNEKHFMLFSLSYMLIVMLSGERGHQMICLISLGIIYFYKNNIQLDLNRIIRYSVLGVILLIFVDLIFDLRQYSISYFLSNYQMFISNVLKKNILIETIHSFGATIYTPYLVVDGMGTDYNPFFGETFIKSGLQIVPAVTESMRAINNASILGRALHSNHAIGGSFAGELYYNFREWYSVFATILGFIYGRFSSRIYYSIKNKDGYTICKIIPYLMCSLWWIRDSIGNLTRSVVWLMILFFLFNRIMNNGYSNDKSNIGQIDAGS